MAKVYGMKVNQDGTIQVNRFPENTLDLPEGYVVLTKAKYDQIVAAVNDDPAGEWDGKNWIPESQASKDAKEEAKLAKKAQEEEIAFLAADEAWLERYNRFKANGDI